MEEQNSPKFDIIEQVSEVTKQADYNQRYEIKQEIDKEYNDAPDQNCVADDSSNIYGEHTDRSNKESITHENLSNPTMGLKTVKENKSKPECNWNGNHNTCKVSENLCSLTQVNRNRKASRKGAMAQSSKQTNTHVCAICGQQCRSKYQLVEHNRVHSREKVASCSICNKTFSHISTFNLHMRSLHTGIINAA